MCLVGAQGCDKRLWRELRGENQTEDNGLELHNPKKKSGRTRGRGVKGHTGENNRREAKINNHIFLNKNKLCTNGGSGSVGGQGIISPEISETPVSRRVQDP